jgi:IS30 family transposase
MTSTTDYAPLLVSERISRAETARRLGVTTGTVDRMIKRGLLNSRKGRATGLVTLDSDEVDRLREQRDAERATR